MEDWVGDHMIYKLGFGWRLIQCTFDNIDYELWLLYMSSNLVQPMSLSQSNSVAIKKCFDYNFLQCFMVNCSFRHSCLNYNVDDPSRYCHRNKG